MVAEAVTDELVSAAQRGDNAAVRVIYDGLAPVVYGYLTAKGVQDPEAVTSDVFVSVFQRLERVTGGAAGLRKFVLSIAHARMVDDVRRRQRQPVPVEYEPATDDRVSDSAEGEAMREIGTARVVALLGELPAAQREVLLLRVIADLSIEQVAEITQKSPGAVKQLQRRGLLALRAVLESDGVTPG
ncbi:MAG: polymerase subunit sigma-70 [Pseudonocardiales bacterium]|nr:polymerase subunit sigma-70 [Pseudonocardiales bacterium]